MSRIESAEIARVGISRRALLKTGSAGVGAAALPSLLGACKGEKLPGAEKPKGLENVEQVQSGPETPGVLYPEGYKGPKATVKKPFADGSKTFKVVVQQDAGVVGDWNRNGFTRWLEQRTGLKVEFQAILVTGSDGRVDLTKVNAMLASGELPDAFLSLPFSNDQISLYGQQGIFVALDDYIETYAPEMRRVMSEYPDFRRLGLATDGKTYQFAGVNDCYHCRVGNSRAFVNKAYVEQVGGKIPATTDELRTLLKLLKANDPTGKGNIIPFAASVNNQIDRFIMNAFLYNPGGDQTGGWLRLNQGKVEFVANQTEWREGLRFLRSLSDDGTLDRDAFTTTSEALLRAGNQGRVGIARAWNWSSFADIKYDEGALWRDYVTIPPLKGPAGVAYTAWDHYVYRVPGLVITSACSNPELLVQWADYQMELEAVIRAYGGDRDKNWRWGRKGTKSINGSQAVWELDTWPAPQGTSWLQYSVMYRSNDFRLGQYVDPAKPNYEQGIYQESTKYERFAEPQDFQLPPLIFDESLAAQKADTAVAIDAHVKQSMAKFAIGELDINDESQWNGYVAQFDKIGLAPYVEMYQKAYDGRPQ